ncbi:hypothetical protein ACFQU7_24705 [Pseudoroseomonas wenyumeiae]
MAFLFITHDLRLVRGFAQRCYVMQDGQPVEVAEPFGQGPVPPALGRCGPPSCPRGLAGWGRNSWSLRFVSAPFPLRYR